MLNAMQKMHALPYKIVKKEAEIMAFVIKPDKIETENKTIRFPTNLIADIERAIVKEDVTFSGFVIQACEYALENMEEKKKK